MFETTRRKVLKAAGVGSVATLAGCMGGQSQKVADQNPNSISSSQEGRTADKIAADPTNIPQPIDRKTSKTHNITLRAQELVGEIEPGVKFNYMTFNERIPGPMIRVRQGDTIYLTLENPETNNMIHNVDFHAVYGTGGGAEATTVNPGEEETIKFKATYPGAYIYHCAVPNLDYHISSGMFGMIVVEPRKGLPNVDKEFYLGQHEVYTDKPAGKKGQHNFDFDAMKNEQPTYVLLNGEKYAYASSNYGPLKAKKGDRVRIFMVTGGPNITSNFHPIGNVWKEAYPQGSLSTNPQTDIQTIDVPPGSCLVAEMDTHVPETIKLVDHALSRVARKGMLAEIKVNGTKNTEIFDPNPSTETSTNK